MTDPNSELDRVFGGEDGVSPIRFGTVLTPRAIYARAPALDASRARGVTYVRTVRNVTVDIYIYVTNVRRNDSA